MRDRHRKAKPPTVLEQVESAVTDAGQALDALDECVSDLIWCEVTEHSPVAEALAAHVERKRAQREGELPGRVEALLVELEYLSRVLTEYARAT